MSGECRPPAGTPPGSVFDLIQTRPGDAYPVIACWCEGDEWFLWGGRRTMTPAEVDAKLGALLAKTGGNGPTL